MQHIHLPSGLTGFRNSMTTIEMAQSGREVYLLHGELERGEVPFCPACGQKMHIHGSRITMLRHLCFGPRLSAVSFEKRRYRCPCCGHTEMESVPFKAASHNITRELLQFTRDLLAYGFTNKEVSELTGLGKNTVKEIDLQRLKDKYTVDGGHGRRLYCRLTSLSRSLQIFLRINLDGTTSRYYCLMPVHARLGLTLTPYQKIRSPEASYFYYMIMLIRLNPTQQKNSLVHLLLDCDHF